MIEEFDAVVIGSGFGGSVMTYRLAEAGMSVCLLERGKAYPPNSFPRAPHELSKNFWDPSKGLYGMFNVWSFKDSGALVSSGLGGGSLIYANVIARKDEKWFKEDLPNGGYKSWVVQYRQLERHYEAVELMLNAQKYPLRHSPYNSTLKTHAMRAAAGKMNASNLKCDWLPLNLAVAFKSHPVSSPDEDRRDNPPIVGAPIDEPFPNIHSVRAGYAMPRSTCRLCGECDIGCNYGSKNTLDFNYLSAAIQQTKPADIRTLCEVKKIEPNRTKGKGYLVTYKVHKVDATSENNIDERQISCKYLILSAGTFGSPYLLLKNQRSFPALSSTLGSRFSVNGDLLSFIVKSMETKNGKSVPRRLDPNFGPVITSAIRFGDDLDEQDQKQGKGFYVEDGGHPYLLSWMSEISGFAGFLSRTVHFLKIILKYRLGLNNDADLGAEISDIIGEAKNSMSSLPILTMGRDAPNAKLFLKNDKFLDCDWNIKNSQNYYDRVRQAGKAIAKSLNAEFMDNPSYKWNFHQILTAHPLGGCAMAENATEGVLDACGEVFGYPGLFVADGSVMPGPVGPNPSLTIAALSDRFAEHIIANFKGEKHDCSQ